MLVDENSMNNNIIVVLANTEEIALTYGNQVRPMASTGIMPMHRRSELYLLYGHRNMPLVVAPGTLVQEWHKELDHHIATGRLKPMSKYRKIQVG